MPSVSRRAVVLAVVGALVFAAVLYGLVPRLADVSETWGRFQDGNGWWFVIGIGLEVGSYLGYVVLLRYVLRGTDANLGIRESAEITLAGVVATRVLGAGGAGGIALTAWALRRFGLTATQVAERMAAFLVILYAVFMFALLGSGLGLWTGVLEGDAPSGVSMAAWIFGLTAIVAALGIARWVKPRGAGRLPSAVRALGDGVRLAIWYLRRADAALVGAIAWWAFDIAVLWACFHAFGEPPPIGIIVLSYYAGMLANLLPIPGGVGGVEGGMVGVFAACGVDAGLALVAVLAYRAIAFWLPMIPGFAAYVSLRGSIKRADAERAAEQQRDGAPADADAAPVV